MLLYLHPLNKAIGALAQLVEQRTENPCVPGSIPGGTTTKTRFLGIGFFGFIAYSKRITDQGDQSQKLCVCVC